MQGQDGFRSAQEKQGAARRQQMLQRALAFHQQGDLAQAKNAYSAILQEEPDQFDALHLSGLIAFQTRDFDQAEFFFARAAAVKNDFAPLHSNRGNALNEMKRFDDALASYDRAIALQPGFVDAHYNRGFSLQGLKRLDEALASYDKAILLQPDHAAAYNNRGNTLHELRRYGEALTSFDRAIAIKPDFAEACNNSGIVLQELKRPGEALARYAKAIAIKPDFVDAYYNCGVAFQELARFDDARLAYGRALEIERQMGARDGVDMKWVSDVYSLDLLPASFESEEELNRRFDELRAGLRRCLQDMPTDAASFAANRRLIDRFLFNMNGFYIAYLQKNVVDVMKDYSAVIARALGEAEAIKAPRRPGRIRLGIASGLLQAHNGANWAYDWLAHLPRGDYEFFTYAFNTGSDGLTEKFRELGTHRSLRFDRDHFAAAIETMRADDLDLLMLPDVGMTPCSRLLSCHRIARTQFAAWGHPITTGSAHMDYFLSSDLMEPDDAQSHYSEKLVRLPNLALFLKAPAPGTAPPVAFDLPEGRILFGCLQATFKYLPQYDSLLARIAKAAPQATFVFLEGHPAYATATLKRRLSGAFARQGVDFNRHVKFLPRVSADGYVDLMSRMDVVLDSVGWTGGNTSLQAIALGKPIVTFPGEFMRGRHTQAMFTMMGLEAHVATSLEDYVSRAIELGRDGALRAQMSAALLERKALLYEDWSLIDALDQFFKSRVPDRHG